MRIYLWTALRIMDLRIMFFGLWRSRRGRNFSKWQGYIVPVFTMGTGEAVFSVGGNAIYRRYS
jgi:hypothetical protein